MTAHETYMRTALEAAREAARLGEIPVGACIVRDGFSTSDLAAAL